MTNPDLGISKNQALLNHDKFASLHHCGSTSACRCVWKNACQATWLGSKHRLKLSITVGLAVRNVATCLIPKQKDDLFICYLFIHTIAYVRTLWHPWRVPGGTYKATSSSPGPEPGGEGSPQHSSAMRLVVRYFFVSFLSLFLSHSVPLPLSLDSLSPTLLLYPHFLLTHCPSTPLHSTHCLFVPRFFSMMLAMPPRVPSISGTLSGQKQIAHVHYLYYRAYIGETFIYGTYKIWER